VTKAEMCPCNYHTLHTNPEWLKTRIGFSALPQIGLPRKKLKKIRIRCPHCKRRLLVGPTFTNERDWITYHLPPHKINCWYKKRKKLI
jgi:hypothetical protein